MTAAARRCPICAAIGRHRRERGEECDHCGLVLTGDATSDIRAGVRDWLLDGAAPCGWHLEGHAVRNAAWALGLDRGGGGWRPAAVVPHNVTLAMLARMEEVDAVATMVRDHAFPRAAILFDAPAAGAAALAVRIPEARVAAHPLKEDFAGQRNRLQAIVDTGWVLHLDTDEAVGKRLRDALGWLTLAADRDGLRALGLPRRNLVDGRFSDLYPDIQYRLVRSDVRFAGRVHERPDVPFDQTSLALAGALTHRLSGERVRRRTVEYGGMAPDGARPQDEAALLRPYRGPPDTAE